MTGPIDRVDWVTKTFFILICALVLATLVANFFTFFFQKNYDFIVEAQCTPTAQTCFARDCSEGSECPPNGLEKYRMFSLNAADFNECLDNSCLYECTSGVIQCEELLCDESNGDICISIPIEE